MLYDTFRVKRRVALGVIELESLTKDYGDGRGIFDASFSIDQGECFGFLGPNGAGKSTAIRHIMGFSRPDSGRATVRGRECWGNAANLMNDVGYLPGEISLPEDMTARSFLKHQRALRSMHDEGRTDELLQRFKLDVNASIRAMSIGERRKLAVVAAFMHDPEVLVLDEPTSGLDPIMQDAFIEFIIEEKRDGKTILMSSHIFNEVAAACDRIAIIKQGRIVEEFGADRISAGEDGRYRGSLLSAVLKNPLHGGLRKNGPDASRPAAICVQDLTKDYGRGKGVFDFNFDIRDGEVFGLVGTNGSGKTTTIRAIMGFIKPNAGSVDVFGRDAWRHAAELKDVVSYVPGEIQFPAFKSADAFFDYQAKLLGLHDRSRRDKLVDLFKLDTRVDPRKMSKGMKQKTALIAALMADDPILILDEPTTGLDPVMRDAFIDLVKEEKNRGKTILMSSHIFEEIEEVCDRVAVIDNGRMVDILSIEELAHYRPKSQDRSRLELETRFKDIFKKEA